LYSAWFRNGFSVCNYLFCYDHLSRIAIALESNGSNVLKAVSVFWVLFKKLSAILSFHSEAWPQGKYRKSLCAGGGAEGTFAIQPVFIQLGGFNKAVTAACPGIAIEANREKRNCGSADHPSSLSVLEGHLDNMKPGEIVTSAILLPGRELPICWSSR
jgi:hypothetical protein